MQFPQCAILQFSNTPSLRVAGFEDEDDDEDEYEAALWEQTAVSDFVTSARGLAILLK